MKQVSDRIVNYTAKKDEIFSLIDAQDVYRFVLEESTMWLLVGDDATLFSSFRPKRVRLVNVADVSIVAAPGLIRVVVLRGSRMRAMSSASLHGGSCIQVESWRVWLHFDGFAKALTEWLEDPALEVLAAKIRQVAHIF